MQRDLGQLNSSSVWRAAQTFDLLAGLVWSVCAAPYGTNHKQIHHQHSFSKLIEYAWHHQSCERGQAGSVGFLSSCPCMVFPAQEAQDCAVSQSYHRSLRVSPISRCSQSLGRQYNGSLQMDCQMDTRSRCLEAHVSAPEEPRTTHSGDVDA